MIFNSLDIDFIHWDIHGRSRKNFLWLSKQVNPGYVLSTILSRFTKLIPINLSRSFLYMLGLTVVPAGSKFPVYLKPHVQCIQAGIHQAQRRLVAKSRKVSMLRSMGDSIAQTFCRLSANNIADSPVKFQSEQIIITPNIVTPRFGDLVVRHTSA